MVTLIIAEKPAAAQKLAEALADGKPSKKAEGGVSYYEFSNGGKEYIIAAAVGHLYGLAQKVKKSGTPVFDIEWLPAYECRRVVIIQRSILCFSKSVEELRSSS